MLNPKYVGIAAGVGFIFTFLIGLFSGISFGYVMLRSCIGALIFGVLSFGIQFLFQKFLSDSTNADFDAAPAASSNKLQGAGGLVNITIDDDVLADDTHGPQFSVTNTRAMMNAKPAPIIDRRPLSVPTAAEAPAQPTSPDVSAVSPLEAVEDEPESAAPAQGFTPVNLVQATQPQAAPAPNAAPAETAAEAPSMPSAAAAQNAPPAADEPVPHESGRAEATSMLDELPDISDMSLPEKKESEEQEVISDSEFASEGETPIGPIKRPKGKSSEPTAQNAAVMAQAIQTILAREN